jgi:Mlc titration factor MtfA (ptsG expression regulator)
MLQQFKDWRRRRVLQRHAVDDALWRDAVAASRLAQGLTPQELERLRQCVTLFLHAKHLSAAGGLVLSDRMRLSIALQACLPILNLDLDYYDGWEEIIVYPDEFVPEFEYMDEDGVVHLVHEPMSGEAWLGGPVILSWRDAAGAHEAPGYNVVIHEFAHKLDMLNGDANGFPPLHADMNRQDWSSAFGAAFADFQRRVAAGEDTALDPYAAQTPGEFFAVVSEAFFETPRELQQDYPEAYAQLRLFYRQDPAQRLTRS